MDSSQSDIRAFANGQNRGSYREESDTFRTDFVDGDQVAVWPDQHHEKGVFELRADRVTDTVPSGITTEDGLLRDVAEIRDHPGNPANRWRKTHPYRTWRQYLGIDV